MTKTFWRRNTLGQIWPASWNNPQHDRTRPQRTVWKLYNSHWVRAGQWDWLTQAAARIKIFHAEIEGNSTLSCYLKWIKNDSSKQKPNDKTVLCFNFRPVFNIVEPTSSKKITWTTVWFIVTQFLWHKESKTKNIDMIEESNNSLNSDSSRGAPCNLVSAYRFTFIFLVN